LPTLVQPIKLNYTKGCWSYPTNRVSC